MVSIYFLLLTTGLGKPPFDNHVSSIIWTSITNIEVKK